MTEIILYVISGFFGLVIGVRIILDIIIKINSQTIAANANTLEMAKLQDLDQAIRDSRAEAASQQTLEHMAKYLVELRQELGVLHEMATLSKINTGRIASIERHVIALHTTVVSETSDQNMIPFPFPIPGGMGPGGMWKPLGIKREDGKYKTEDGEHEADSLEELLSKLANDPQYRIDPNFKQINPSDIEDMRKMFEGELEEDDEKEDWKKGEE